MTECHPRSNLGASWPTARLWQDANQSWQADRNKNAHKWAWDYKYFCKEANSTNILPQVIRITWRWPTARPKQRLNCTALSPGTEECQGGTATPVVPRHHESSTGTGTVQVHCTKSSTGRKVPCEEQLLKYPYTNRVRAWQSGGIVAWPRGGIVARPKVGIVARPKIVIVAQSRGCIVAWPRGDIVARPRGNIVARPRGGSGIIVRPEVVLSPSQEVALLHGQEAASLPLELEGKLVKRSALNVLSTSF